MPVVSHTSRDSFDTVHSVEERNSFPQLTDVTTLLNLASGKPDTIELGLGVLFLKRIVGLWPYLLIVISVAGLAYVFLAASR